jgi:hypothetical protein
MKKILITGVLGHIGSKLSHSIVPGEYGLKSEDSLLDGIGETISLLKSISKK